MAKSVVILRPHDASSEISSAINARGLTPLVEPILSVEYLDPNYPALDKDAPLIFTSANGVRSFVAKNLIRGNPVYAVGDNTAEAARAAGFVSIESAMGTVEDLAELFTDTLKNAQKTPVYIHGDDISVDLGDIFAKKGINIAEIVTYRAILAQKLSIRLLKEADNGEIAAIMFFSVRGARAFTDLVQQYDRLKTMKTVRALCISDAVVDCLSVLPFQEVVVAGQPDRYGMIQMLEQLP